MRMTILTIYFRYFVNDVDEIRAIDNPDYYFKFFINRNLRINMRQRFEFNCKYIWPPLA